MGRHCRRSLVLVLLIALAAVACGGTSRTGGTVTFVSGGDFPPTTIVGTYGVHRCSVDSRTLVDDARLYYAHSTGAPGPADLYYYDMRFAYAHFQADGCTSRQLGEELGRGLTALKRRFLLHNVASDLGQAFRAALNAG